MTLIDGDEAWSFEEVPSAQTREAMEDIPLDELEATFGEDPLASAEDDAFLPEEQATTNNTVPASSLSQNKRQNMGIVAAVALLVIGGMAGACGWLLGRMGPVDSSSDTGNPSRGPTAFPTVPPTARVPESAKEGFPTATPTTGLPKSTEEFLQGLLPDSIKSYPEDSPQQQAFQWLLSDNITVDHISLAMEGSMSDLPDKHAEQILQRFTLTTLYYSTQGDNWASNTSNTNWLDPKITECKWRDKGFASMCSDSQTVDKISLFQNNLNGTIPVEVFELLPNLKLLNLGNNHLRGTLPTNFNKSMAIDSLFLFQNNLTGTIDWPSLPRNMPSLTNLDLANNVFTGRIESDIAGLVSLNNLDVSHNKLNSTIPSEVGLLSTLEELNLGSNQLSGRIPEQVGNMTALKYVLLDDNSLRGRVPTELELLSNAEVMLLDNNEFRGPLPAKLGNLPMLSELSFANNQFKGTIGDEWQSQTLYKLDLANNQLIGTIPAVFGNISSLVGLSVNGNPNVTGCLPDELCSLPFVKADCDRLCIAGCGLCDPPTSSPSMAPTTSAAPSAAPTTLLPESTQLALRDPNTPQAKAYQWYLEDQEYINSMTDLSYDSIQRFALATFYYATNGDSWFDAENWLHHDISECDWFSTFSGSVCSSSVQSSRERGLQGDTAPAPRHLSRLFLNKNNITGTFVPEMAMLSKLEVLSLHQNFVAGTIPTEFGTFKHITLFQLFGNLLSGTIPSQLGLLPKVTQLNLAFNQLTGTIPTTLSQLGPTLESLSASSNLIEGTIPTELGSLSNLEGMYFYKTPNMTGPIPSELGLLTSMTQLQLNAANYTGMLPSELGLVTALQKIYLSDNWNLQGTIPESWGNLSNLAELQLHNTSLTGTVPEGLCDLLDARTLSLLSVDCNKVSCSCSCTCP